MKKAGMVLGIIGGAISILCSIILIIFMAAGGAALQNVGIDQVIDEAQQQAQQNGEDFFNEHPYINDGNLAEMIRAGIGIGLGAVIAFGVLGLIGGVLGLIGGIVIEKKPILSGVFLIIGAVLTALYCVTFILMGIAAIFAFIRQQPPVSPAPANP